MMRPRRWHAFDEGTGGAPERELAWSPRAGDSPLRLTAALGLAIAVAAAGGCGSAEVAEPAAAPRVETRRDAVQDDYHGTTIEDPYRWLEDADAPEVKEWIRAQNEVTEHYLAQAPARARLRERLRELWNYPRWTPPERHGPHWIWRHNDGLQAQSVIYKGTGPGVPGTVLLDPNTLSADGTTSIGHTSFTEDGSLLAYSVSQRGSDWQEWHVLNVETGERLGDRLQWSKFASAAWLRDNSGFFYQRYSAPRADQAHEARTDSPELVFHKLGTRQEDDQLLYSRPDDASLSFSAEITKDGRYLVITLRRGTDRRNGLLFADLAGGNEEPRALTVEFDASYDFIANDGPTFYVVTDRDAPNRRVAAINVNRLDAPTWGDVIPTGEHALVGARVVDDRFVLTYIDAVRHRVRVYTKTGVHLRDIELPGMGTVSGMTGEPDDRELFFTFASLTTPPTVYRHHVASGATTAFRTPSVKFDPDRFVVEQVQVPAADGARIPMYIARRKDLKLFGGHATYLYGYGGFNISLMPAFAPQTIAWLELGGIYAQANLRGGGEFGEEWHRAGMLRNKQRVFDDFIAAAEYLLRHGYTSRQRLAIGGRSNGGLLVGAALTQRPDLFGAAVPEVGVLDMLRYHKFTIGWAWASEYGRSDDAEMFPVLRAYSPLHNVKPGTSYPPTLVMTGDHDDRVLPGHSYKFAAALQAAQAGEAPILLRVDLSAGHGAGKPVAKQIEEAADRWAFLVEALGMPLE